MNTRSRAASALALALPLGLLAACGTESEPATETTPEATEAATEEAAPTEVQSRTARVAVTYDGGIKVLDAQTLEEVGDSDLIVHVVDASHPDPASQLATVRDVIGELGTRDIPEIVVFNKSDLIDDEERLVLRGLEPDAVFASARTGAGIPELLEVIAARIPDPSVEVDLLVPYDRGDIVSTLHEAGRVLEVDYGDEGTHVRALANPELAAQLAEFSVRPAASVAE